MAWEVDLESEASYISLYSKTFRSIHQKILNP
jgi:hypothetical protein